MASKTQNSGLTLSSIYTIYDSEASPEFEEQEDNATPSEEDDPPLHPEVKVFLISIRYITHLKEFFATFVELISLSYKIANLTPEETEDGLPSRLENRSMNMRVQLARIHLQWRRKHTRKKENKPPFHHENGFPKAIKGWVGKCPQLHDTYVNAIVSYVTELFLRKNWRDWGLDKEDKLGYMIWDATCDVWMDEMRYQSVAWMLEEVDLSYGEETEE